MILKVEKFVKGNNKNVNNIEAKQYSFWDNIRYFNYEYVRINPYNEHNEYSKLYCIGYDPWSQAMKDKVDKLDKDTAKFEGFLYILANAEFKNDEYWFIIPSTVDVYLLNDDGDTIEKI